VAVAVAGVIPLGCGREASTIALGLAREYPRVCEPSHQHGEQLCR
jgi:hypothetical protein